MTNDFCIHYLERVNLKSSPAYSSARCASFSDMPAVGMPLILIIESPNLMPTLSARLPSFTWYEDVDVDSETDFLIDDDDEIFVEEEEEILIELDDDCEIWLDSTTLLTCKLATWKSSVLARGAFKSDSTTAELLLLSPILKLFGNKKMIFCVIQGRHTEIDERKERNVHFDE